MKGWEEPPPSPRVTSGGRMLTPKTHTLRRYAWNLVWAIHHPGEALPDLELDGDELVVMRTQEHSFICPLTKILFEIPLKNRDCGHTFSQAAVLTLLNSKQRNKGAILCPIAGCPSKLSRDTLEKDHEMERELRRYVLAKKNQRDQNSDEEGIQDL
eukprot:TRINITY_DN2578_c0_g1_i29.p1 TRINITY_DN2578_c0_g1~~TRINITY_DN2578_c0_g1_i29.p1  ORF type:complete len:156 (-),score=43.78 TRINITY_DN2578_c0_g1_i29:122-589(-)